MHQFLIAGVIRADDHYISVFSCKTDFENLDLRLLEFQRIVLEPKKHQSKWIIHTKLYSAHIFSLTGLMIICLD